MGSIGSIPVSFALKFGFDAIFAAIGFSGVAVDPDTVADDVVAAPVFAAGLPDVDFAGLPVVVGLPVLWVVVLTGLPLVVGLPVLRVVVVTGLPLVVGLPWLRVVVVTGLPLVVGLPVLRIVVDAAGLPLVVGLPLVAGLTDAGGLPDPLPRPWANAGDSVKDVAARKPRIVAETRIRIPPWRGIASAMPRGPSAIWLKSNFLGALIEQF